MAENEEKKKFSISPKTKKILNYVLDAVLLVVLVFAVVIAVSSIKTRAKGYGDYTEIFGSAYVSVASDSMDAAKPADVPADKPEGFKKGDMLKIKMLGDKGKDNLEVGDIITFSTSFTLDNKRVLNTHRIVEIVDLGNGSKAFRTKGDNNTTPDGSLVEYDDVIGIYSSKVKNVGFVMMFMGSSTGFIVFVIVPSVLIVLYCLANLVIVIKKEKKAQTAAAEAEEAQKSAEDAQRLEVEREKIRQELLAEMQSQNAAQPVPIPPVHEPVQIAPAEPAQPAEPAVQPSEPVQPAEPVQPTEPAQPTPETNDPSKENPEE